jgi:hypothetical protein
VIDYPHLPFDHSHILQQILKNQILKIYHKDNYPKSPIHAVKSDLSRTFFDLKSLKFQKLPNNINKFTYEQQMASILRPNRILHVKMPNH